MGGSSGGMSLLERRVPAVVLSLTLLAPTAAFGKPAFKPGSYRGADDGDYLTISFVAGRKKAKNLGFELDRMPGKCSNGYTLSGSDVPYDIPDASIGQRGTFKLTLKSDPEYPASKVWIRGKLKGTHVTGTFRMKLGPVDDDVTCDTGRVAWSGARR